MIGPTRADCKWQASVSKGFESSHFAIDWEAKQATCPEGHTSISWTPTIDTQKNESIKIRFSTKDCQACPSQTHCTHSQSRVPRRLLSIRPKAQYEARHSARERQTTETFNKQYAARSGIEATISQGVRAFGMRRSRSIGLAKTSLQHLGIAAAINVVRVMAWLDGMNWLQHAFLPSRGSTMRLKKFPNSVKSGHEPLNFVIYTLPDEQE